ncbi:MAG TPA: hypothetical protein VK327_11285 [Candidatus Paceibacterota bacterium]|nr:hypothetical protein [Candidatus Paceibacterota bacterium]
MKLKLAVLFAVSVLVVTLTGCSTTQQRADKSPRFREGRDANVVLRFSSWDYTFMSKPFYAEDGFMQQVRRESLNQVLNKFQVERGMAVVVVGWQYNDEVLGRLVSDWKNILGGDCGFQRVVILRASKNQQLNGSVIVEDASISKSLHASIR